MNEMQEHMEKLKEHNEGYQRGGFGTNADTERITKESYQYLHDVDEFKEPIVPRKIGKCPLWALVHRMDGKQTGDRCNPGCQLYLDELADCSINILARGNRNDNQDIKT